LILLTKNDGGFKKLINYEKGKTTPKQVVGMSVLIICLGMGGMYLAGFLCYGIIPYAPPMMIAPIPVPLAVINLILLPVSTALAENSIYLGCGVNTIKNRYLSVILPAFFFAVQHSFIPTLPDARYMIYRFLSFLPLTILLCIIYRKNRNPLPIMIGHAVIDLLTAGQILATSAIPGFYDMMTSL
jgi:membrane protease YdiL (CAAX protease family)